MSPVSVSFPELEAREAREKRILSGLPERSQDDLRRELINSLPPADPPPGPLRAAAFGANEALFGQYLPQGARDALARGGVLPRRGQGHSDLDPASRAASVGGQVVGGSLPFAAAGSALLPKLAAAAPQTLNAATRFLRPMADHAARNPGQFAAQEAGAVAGAAQGGMLADGVFPGNNTARTVGEIGGSIVNPVGFLARVTGKTGGAIATAMKSMTKAGREQNAAKILQDITAATGEDPVALAARLDDLAGQSPGPTVGQISNSSALRAMETHLARSDPRFAGERENRAQAAYRDTRKLIDDMVNSGDPALLAAAATVRQRHFETVIDDRISQAQREVAEAYAKVGRVSGADRASASKTAEASLQSAYRQARDVETELYNAIPTDRTGEPNSLRTLFARNKEEMLPTERAVVEEHLAPLLGAKQDPTTGAWSFTKPNVTAGDLLRIRRRAGAMARDAAGRGERDLARQYNDVKNAANADLAEMGGVEAKAAAQYSAALNDRFTRSFGGDALQIDSAGDLRIRPELLLDQAYAGGGIRGLSQFNELAAAGDFGDEAARTLGRGLEESFGLGIRNAEESFLRDAASRILDRSGNVNPERLRLFMRDNAELLERFPTLARDLADVQTAQAAFQRTDAAMKRASKFVTSTTAFARAAGVEDPSAAVRAMVSGPSPARQYRQLAVTAKRSGQGAVDGLRTASLDHARNAATSNAGEFSFRVFNEQVFARQGNRQPLAEMMIDNGVMTRAQSNRMEKLLRRAMDIEDAMKDPTRVNEVIPETDAMFDLAVRMVGANLGGQAAVGTGGQSLVLAGAGVRFMRRQLERMPATRTHDILVAAMENPHLAAALLRRDTSREAIRRTDGQIRAALLQAGIIADIEDDSEN